MSWLLCRAHARLGRVLRALTLAALLATAASAAEPNKNLTNKNPQALPVGITFHSSLPSDMRKAIVDDLYWLSTRGPIDDERLRHLLQIDEPMTGASLVAWFLDRVHVIGLFGWCPPSDFVVISAKDAGFTVTRSRIRCAPNARNSGAAVPSVPFTRAPASAAQAITVDRNLRIIPEAWPDGFRWPVMVVPPSFLKVDPSIPARVARLGTLLHEATHVEGIPHGTCKAGDWKLSAYTLGPIGFRSSTFRVGESGCDDPNVGSAYAVEASFYRAMAEACQCPPRESDRIRFYAWRTWVYQGVPLKQPVVVPSTGDLLNIRGLSGKTLNDFHPAEFMEAGLSYVENLLRRCDSRCSEAEKLVGWRRQVIALREFGESLKEIGAFVGSWEASNPQRAPVKRPLDVAGARKWLAAAAKAAKDGYNVETMSLVACADLQDQC